MFQIQCVRFISHVLKCSLRLKSTPWVSYPTLWIVLLRLKSTLWGWYHIFEMSFETEIHSLRFILYYWNVVWDSNPLFEFQFPFFKMFFETQIHSLRFISHFLKCVLRLKSILWVSYPIFKNVLWDSNPLFEFHIPFFKMFFETQILPLSFIYHF